MPAVHHSIFLQAGCSSRRPTNSVKALKAKTSVAVVVQWLILVFFTTHCFSIPHYQLLSGSFGNLFVYAYKNMEKVWKMEKGKIDRGMGGVQEE